MTWRMRTVLGTIAGLLLGCAASNAVFLDPSPDAQTRFVRPRLNIGPGRHVSLVWEKERPGQSYDIYFTRSTDHGKTWQQAVRWLDQDKPAGSWSSDPQIQGDDKGHLYVVWRTRHRDGRKDVLFTASKDFGTTFGPT